MYNLATEPAPYAIPQEGVSHNSDSCRVLVSVAPTYDEAYISAGFLISLFLDTYQTMPAANIWHDNCRSRVVIQAGRVEGWQRACRITSRMDMASTRGKGRKALQEREMSSCRAPKRKPREDCSKMIGPLSNRAKGVEGHADDGARDADPLPAAPLGICRFASRGAANTQVRFPAGKRKLV